jgi:hypothetical protein
MACHALQSRITATARPPLSADDEALHREAMQAGHAAMAVFEAETLAAMQRFADYVSHP